MTTVRENKLETKIIDINNLYSRIIHNHISDLLKIINSKYPTKFPKNVLSIELEQIISNVNLSHPAAAPATKISSRSKST